jgi:hypothetical protein
MIEQIHHQIISRANALAANRIRYFTGKPCKNGHVAERYATTGCCTQCLKVWKKHPHSGAKRDGRTDYARHLETLGLKLRQIYAHDDDWPVLLEMANDFYKARDRVNYETNVAPAVAAKALPTQGVQGVPSAGDDGFGAMVEREIGAHK